MAQLMDRIVHVRLNGRSEELRLSHLNLQLDASDEQIKQAVTRHFDLPQHALTAYVIVRTSEAIIVRPEAIYG
jgi:hypothetical protein